MNRRQFLRAAGVAGVGGVAATSGCVGAITGSEPIEVSASQATVPAATLSNTGFEQQSVEPLVIEQPVEIAGQRRTVVVENQLAQYDKAVEIPGVGRYRAALFAVLSTPAVEIAGRSLNPVADLSSRALAERMLTQYEGVSGLRRTGSETVSVLGADAEVGLFEADVTVAAGVTTETALHVTEAVRAGGDFVVCVGAYPTLLSGEAEDVRAMMQAVQHAGN
ncbi:DUF6517 family protein [Halobaculum sp. P14]